jgi:hypothetical protein
MEKGCHAVNRRGPRNFAALPGTSVPFFLPPPGTGSQGELCSGVCSSPRVVREKCVRCYVCGGGVEELSQLSRLSLVPPGPRERPVLSQLSRLSFVPPGPRERRCYPSYPVYPLSRGPVGIEDSWDSWDSSVLGGRALTREWSKRCYVLRGVLSQLSRLSLIPGPVGIEDSWDSWDSPVFLGEVPGGECQGRELSQLSRLSFVPPGSRERGVLSQVSRLSFVPGAGWDRG